MEISNEEERLNKSTETLKCHDCYINLEQYYSYCRMCKQQFCLNCLIRHNHGYLEKIKNDNFKLKEIKLDEKNKEKKNNDFNKSEIKNIRNYGIDLLRIYSMFNVIILHALGIGKILHSKN